MLLSERHVVSFISTFSDVHSVDVLYFFITASARWFCTVLHWITCADAVALMMMTSSALHWAWGVTISLQWGDFELRDGGVDDVTGQRGFLLRVGVVMPGSSGSS